jgi:EAL domain-containing protein (putative c-di-GMP-specific phosphodiesterase class I)
VQVSCSIGVTFYPRDGQNADALMRHADVAMYRAKEQGSNNVQRYASEMDASLEEKLMLLEGLRAAIDSCAEGFPGACQFELLYQPKVDLRSGRVFGVEALIRWHHPEHGTVSPLRFIGLAEESGLIVPIGEWVVRTACRQSMAWRDAGLAPLTVSVNVSARQLRDPDFLRCVEQVLESSGLAPELLELELTESMLMQDRAAAIGFMQAVRALGVRLSIDDFGTGYSSLAYLQSFPINQLKIDRSFVRPLPEHGKTLASAVIRLAHGFGLTVVAEGVEERGQLEWLQQAGCEYAQGYLLGRPVPLGALRAQVLDEQAPGQRLAAA